MLLISGEGALVVVPEWRAQQGWRGAGDRRDVGAAIGQGLLQFLRLQRAMVGVPGRCRVEAQDVTFSVFAPHDIPAQFAATGSRRAGLHEEHGFDPRLQRVLRQALKHRDGRIPPTRCAGAVIERQQKPDRRLRLQTLFGLRSHFNGRCDTTQQTHCQGAHR
ncbi:hypothetical protein D3C71_1680350 [compost metagenome]